MRVLPITQEVRRELQENIEPLYKEQFQQFFKEQVKMFGVRMPVVREIARSAFRKIRRENKRDIFALCRALLRSGQGEEATVAFDWAWRLKNAYDANDVAVFEEWLKRFVSNWGACDDLCSHALGEAILQFPLEATRTLEWARSKNRWMRRGAAVALIPGLRRGRFLEELFQVCDILMGDQDDLVQKGCGWALKEASSANLKEVFHYVMRHKDAMPRVALRYAIEKMPYDLKKSAMTKQ